MQEGDHCLGPSPGFHAASAARHRPSSAARLLAAAGNMHRFASRAHFASWNGTAPLDASSGQQQRHRLSRAGHRRINRALPIMAVAQLRNPTEGRACYDARKAAGKTSMEAIRCLKRRLSTIACRQMLHDQDSRRAAGPGGHSGTTLQSSVTDLTPGHRLFGQATSRTRHIPA
ncbi:MAG: transposase [Streptosporangiaceae bacterium]